MTRPYLGPAIIDGEIQYLSASSIAKFDPSQTGGCNRKWWFRYVARLPEPELVQHAKGIEVHKQLEHYIKTGEDILGEIARAAKAFATPLVGCVEVERPFDGDLFASGLPVIGYIDVVNRAGAHIRDDGAHHEDPKGTIEVLDWKTTSNLDYAKPGSDLVKTVQMAIYGEWARLQGATHSRLSHVYLTTRGRPVAEKRTALVPADQVAVRWLGVEEIAEKMKSVAVLTKCEDVEPNWDACSVYGGCAFRSQCPQSKEQTIKNIFGGGGGGAMGLLDRLRQQSAAPIMGVVVPAPGVPPIRPGFVGIDTLPARKVAVATEITKLEAEEAAAKAAMDKPNGVEVPGGAGVLPPDAPRSGSKALAAEPIPPESMAVFPPAIRAAAEEVAPSTVQTPMATETPKKRGRPPKVAAPTEIGKKADSTGITLFVDVIADGIDARPFDVYVGDLCHALEEEYKVADIRFAPADSPLSFGKYKGALAALIRQHPPNPGVYLARDVRESEIRQVVVEALKPLCAVFVRGV